MSTKAQIFDITKLPITWEVAVDTNGYKTYLQKLEIGAVLRWPKEMIVCIYLSIGILPQKGRHR